LVISLVSADAHYTRPTSTQVEAQQWSFDIGFEKEFSSRFTMFAEFSQYRFASDTVNIFSQFSNLISINAEFDLTIFDLGLSYDRFLGDPGASYFSIDISTFHKISPVFIMPMLQVVFMSQTVEDRYLPKGKGKKKNDQIVETTDLTGLANTMLTLVAVYPVVENVSLSIVPSLILNHQSALSVESVRFVWNANLRYSFSF